MRRALMLCTLAALFAAMLTAGCSSSANGPKVEAHEWKAMKLAGTAYTGAAPITATFSAGKVSGSTGVNQYSGTYSFGAGNTITIDPGAMTEVGGSPDAMKAEREFLAGMKSAASYAVDEDSLTLFDASGVAVLAFEAQAGAK